MESVNYLVQAMSLFSLVITLFLIMDPFGSIGHFLMLMKGINPTRRKWVIFREMLIALGIMMVFSYLGDFLLIALHVSKASLPLAGGIILFLTAIRMIFPSDRGFFFDDGKIEEPFIVPIATPMIAGPSVLATIMLYAQIDQSPLKLPIAIFCAWGLCTFVFTVVYALRDKLPTRAPVALERLMGLILTMMAVEMFLQGVRLFMTAQAS